MSNTALKYKKYNPTTEQEHWFVDCFTEKGTLDNHNWYETETEADTKKTECPLLFKLFNLERIDLILNLLCIIYITGTLDSAIYLPLYIELGKLDIIISNFSSSAFFTILFCSRSK